MKEFSDSWPASELKHLWFSFPRIYNEEEKESALNNFQFSSLSYIYM